MARPYIRIFDCSYSLPDGTNANPDRRMGYEQTGFTVSPEAIKNDPEGVREDFIAALKDYKKGVDRVNDYVAHQKFPEAAYERSWMQFQAAYTRGEARLTKEVTPHETNPAEYLTVGPNKKGIYDAGYYFGRVEAYVRQIKQQKQHAANLSNGALAMVGTAIGAAALLSQCSRTKAEDAPGLPKPQVKHAVMDERVIPQIPTSLIAK